MKSIEHIILVAFLVVCFTNFESSALDKKKNSLRFPQSTYTPRLSVLPTKSPQRDEPQVHVNALANTSEQAHYEYEPLSLMGLPPELLENIVHQLQNIDDVEAVASFAASSRLQQAIAQPLLHRLRPITINVEDINEENLRRLATQHQRTYRITVILRAQSYPALTRAELELLARYFPYVRELNISETDITAEDLQALAHFRNLTALNISGNNLNAKALTIIAQLPNANRIKKLIF